MRKHFLTTALSLALASFAAAPLAAQVTVTTGAPADHITPVGRDSDFGTLPTAILQTFVAPNGTNNLASFSFWITGAFGGGSSLLLDASIYAFSTDHIIGSALFTTQLNGTDALTDEIRTFGSIASPLSINPLAPGNVYALVVSAADRFQSSPDHSTISVGTTTTNAYANGSLFMSQANNLGALKVGGAFVPVADNPDMAFTAIFTNVASSVVPEPASILLFGAGLAFLGAVGLSRKRRV